MHRHLRRLLPPAAATVALLSMATPAQAKAVTDLDQGHVDVLGIGFEDSTLALHVHDEENGVEYTPAQVRLVAKPGARTTVPGDPAYGFLGAPGDDVWILPQIQDPELLWPGIGAEEVPAGVFANDALRIDILSVCGPGDLSLFTTGAFGAPAVSVDSGDGLPDSIAATAGGHEHQNWAFEAAGTYTVRAKVSGVLASTGKRISSAVATYTFRVQQ